MKTKNLKEFEKASEMIFKKIKPSKTSATIVLLSGDLGAGKTTMTQIWGKLLGIKKIIASPTFVLMRNYNLQPTIYNLPIAFERLVHIDAYRLESEKEILKLGFEEIVSDPKNLVLIEWPEKIEKVLPKNAIKISVKHLKDEGREISF